MRILRCRAPIRAWTERSGVVPGAAHASRDRGKRRPTTRPRPYREGSTVRGDAPARKRTGSRDSTPPVEARVSYGEPHAMLREKHLNPIAHVAFLTAERAPAWFPAERRARGILGELRIEL